MLCGRDDELRTLHEAARAGEGALVAGPAGVGKTFLVSAFLEDLESRGHRVERFVGSPGMRDVPLSALARIAGSINAGASPGIAQAATAIAGALAAVDGEPTPALLFDDAHLLDAGSLLVVNELVSRRSATVWLTVRTGETIPDAVLSLWRSGSIGRLDIEPLTRVDADALAAELLDGAATAGLLDALWEQTTGTPLYLRELINDARAEGAIGADGDAWGLLAPLRAGRRVHDLLRHRIERLDPEQREVVQLVAAAEPITAELLSPPHQTVALELERRGILQWDDPAAKRMLRPGHPLLGEVARANITPARAHEIAKTLADRLLGQDHRPHGAALRLAAATDGLDLELPGALLVDAAREALAAFEPEQARRLAERAVESAPTAEAHHVLGDVCQLAGEIDRADHHLTRASELASSDSQIVRIAHSRAVIHAYLRGDPRTAVGILRDAAPLLSSTDAQLSLRSETAIIAALLGRFPEVLATGAEILAVEGLADDTRSITLGNVCYAQAMLIELDGFDENWQQAIALLEAQRLAEKPAEHDLLWAIRSSVMIERAEFVEGFATLNDHLRACEEQSLYRGITELVGAHMLIIKGDVGALDAVERSLEQLGQMDPFSTTTLARAAGALAAALAGDEPRCAAYLDGLSIEAVADDPRAVAWLGRALSAQLALAGDLNEAAQLAASAGRAAVKGTQLGWGSLTLHDAARLGRPDLVAGELTDALGETGADYMETLARHARAAAAGDAAGLRDCARIFGRMGAWLHAGESWLDLAHTDVDETQRRSSIVSAQLIARQCTLRHWPRWSTVDTVLSDREVEVAVLAVSGLSSKVIAERLFVSTRTVDNHLGRIYRRLDLDGRPDLVETFGEVVRPDPPIEASAPD